MDDRPHLHRILKPVHVGALALGCVIGFGCFVLPGDFLRTAGPLGAALGVSLGGLAMLVIVRSYGTMVRVLPVAGAEFAYANLVCGRRHAFVCGWLLALGYLSIVPLNATALGVLAAFVAPDVFLQGFLYSVAGFDVFIGPVLLASLAIVVVGVFHYRGVRGVGSLQVGLTSVLVGGVVLLGISTGFSPEASPANWAPAFAPDRSAISGMLAVLAFSPFLYVGFDTLPQAAEEFDFSPRLGRSLMTWSILAGVAMYVVLILVTSAVIPWTRLVSDSPEWATGTAVSAGLGSVGLTVLSLTVVTAVATGINGFYMATSRLMFSMGRAKLLPAWFARLHPTHGTPVNAIVFIGAASLVAPWFGREVLLWVVDMSSVGTAVGYGYTCIAAYAIARGFKTEGRTVETTAGDRVVAAAGVVVSAVFILLLTVPGMPAFMAVPSWVALGVWAGLGVVFYLVRARDYESSPVPHVVTGIGDDRADRARSVDHDS